MEAALVAPLGPSHHNSPHSSDQGTNQGILQLFSISVPVMHSKARETTTGCTKGPTEPTIKPDLS